jgi:diaminopimelate decarboxylase
LPHIRLRGVQMHIGSQITSVKPFVTAVKKMLPLVARLKARHGIEFFSIGGGIGIVYDPALESGRPQWWQRGNGRGDKGRGTARRPEQRPLDDEPLPMTATDYAAALVPLLRPLGLRVLIEPGRFIVGNAGILVTRVEYVKQTAHKNFVIVDAAMNDLIRPAFYEAYHEILPVVASRTAKTITADVVGPVCESGDFFAKNRAVTAVKAGDFLAIFSAGAYGFTMASNYNSRPRPAEVLVGGTKRAVVRRREKVDELVRGESVPNWA